MAPGKTGSDQALGRLLSGCSLHQALAPLAKAALVGLGRLELPTSRLSGVRSNHLSYRPDLLSPALQAIRERKRNGDGSVPQR